PGRMIGRGDEHAQTIGGRVVGADDRATYLEADARHLARVEGLHREEERPGGERVGSWAVDQRLWSRTCGRLIAAVGAGSGGADEDRGEGEEPGATGPSCVGCGRKGSHG